MTENIFVTLIKNSVHQHNDIIKKCMLLICLELINTFLHFLPMLKNMN